jgi:hypothetical protein
MASSSVRCLGVPLQTIRAIRQLITKRLSQLDLAGEPKVPNILKMRRKSLFGVKHMVRYVFRNGSQPFFKSIAGLRLQRRGFAEAVRPAKDRFRLDATIREPAYWVGRTRYLSGNQG